ncbi:MAG: acetyl-CoA C-acyltransferase [Dehalococcoidia bacterium]|nr:acetyl-CoA C-acyltransferase [Dehalococcoidia bacterium]
MNSTDPVILSAARTPFGRFGGAFCDLSAVELGTVAARAALERAQIAPDDVDTAVFGQIYQGGARMNPARQVAMQTGVPSSVPAMTINQVCASGLQAVALAGQAIRLGDAEVALAGGMESMSQAPYVLPTARWGARLGHGRQVDTLLHDGLWDVFHDCHMASTAEHLAQEYGVTREAQDEFALRSQRRYAAALAACHFADEIVPVEVPQRRGEPRLIATDEHPRPDTTLDRLAQLRPAFDGGSTITAGNAAGINDGAAALIVAAPAWARQRGLTPLATLRAVKVVGVEPMRMGIGPVPAIRAVLAKTGLTLADIDLLEVNEAFAAQVLTVEAELGWDRARVNVNGGAIAIGHPLGASGARVLSTLIFELHRRTADRGIAALCVGGGMGIAALVEREAAP